MPRVITRGTGRGLPPPWAQHWLRGCSRGDLCGVIPGSTSRVRHGRQTAKTPTLGRFCSTFCGRLGTCLWRVLGVAILRPPHWSSTSVEKFFAPPKFIDCSLVSRQSSPDVSKCSLLVGLKYQLQGLLMTFTQHASFPKMKQLKALTFKPQSSKRRWRNIAYFLPVHYSSLPSTGHFQGLGSS